MLVFLPAGFAGFMVAGLFAAYRSTIETHLNWGTSYLVHDFYQRFFGRNASQRDLVLAGRVVTVLLMAAGVGVHAVSRHRQGRVQPAALDRRRHGLDLLAALVLVAHQCLERGERDDCRRSQYRSDFSSPARWATPFASTTILLTTVGGDDGRVAGGDVCDAAGRREHAGRLLRQGAAGRTGVVARPRRGRTAALARFAGPVAARLGAWAWPRSTARCFATGEFVYGRPVTGTRLGDAVSCGGHCRAWSQSEGACSPQIAQDNVARCGQRRPAFDRCPTTVSCSDRSLCEEQHFDPLSDRSRRAVPLRRRRLLACSRAGSSVASGAKTIGVSIQNREAQFYQDMEAGMRARGRKVRLQARRRRRQSRQRQAAESSRGLHLEKGRRHRSDALRLASDRQCDRRGEQRRRFRSSPPTSRTRAAKARSSRTSRATTCRAAFKPAS